MDLIKRYTSGEQISAGFDTGVRKWLTGAAAEGDGATVLKWIISLTDAEKLSKMTVADVTRMQNPLIDVRERPQVSGTRSGMLTKFEPGTDAFCMANKVVASKDAKDESPLAMYNHLNSSWSGSTGMKMHSPRESEFLVRPDQHMAVNLGGGRWASSIVLGAELARQLHGHRVRLLPLRFFGALRRLVTILGSTPFAVLGFQASIANYQTRTI